MVINLKSKIMTIAKFIPSVEIKHAKDTTDNSKVWFDYWIKQTKEDISNLSLGNPLKLSHPLMLLKRT